MSLKAPRMNEPEVRVGVGLKWLPQPVVPVGRGSMQAKAAMHELLLSAEYRSQLRAADSSTACTDSPRAGEEETAFAGGTRTEESR